MPDTLPDNIAALRALVLTAWAERDAERTQKGRLIEERDQLAGQNERLRQLLRQLQRLQFGRRSEKLDPDQLNLALEDLEQAVAESEAGQRSPTRCCGATVLRNVARHAVRFLTTCRGSRSSSSRRTPPARAAAERCM